MLKRVLVLWLLLIAAFVGIWLRLDQPPSSGKPAPGAAPAGSGP